MHLRGILMDAKFTKNFFWIFLWNFFFHQPKFFRRNRPWPVKNQPGSIFQMKIMIFHDFSWFFMIFHDFSWFFILLGTSGYFWVFLGASGCFWVLLGASGYFWTLLDAPGRSWRWKSWKHTLLGCVFSWFFGMCVFMIFHDFFMIFHDFSCFFMLLSTSECFWMLLSASGRFWTLLNAPERSWTLRDAKFAWLLWFWLSMGRGYLAEKSQIQIFRKKNRFFFSKKIDFFFLAQKNSWVDLGMGKHPNHRFSMFSGPSVRSFEYFGEQIIRRAFCAPVEPTCYGIWYRLNVREKLW